MHTNWVIFKINWQKMIEYRGELISHALLGLISFAILIFLFKEVFAHTASFSGYTFGSIFTYLAMAKILHFTARTNTSRMIADEIKEGTLSAYLLKPFNYIRYWGLSFLADRSVEMMIRFFIMIFIFLVFPSLFQLISINNLLVFLIFLGLALILNFFINIFIAMTAFWVTDIRLYSTVIGLAMAFLSGEVIPLDTLPEFIKKICLLLPFQFTIFFPIKIFQGSVGGIELIKGLAIVLFWIGTMILIINWLWKKGVKKYESVGV